MDLATYEERLSLMRSIMWDYNIPPEESIGSLPTKSSNPYSLDPYQNGISSSAKNYKELTRLQDKVLQALTENFAVTYVNSAKDFMTLWLS